MPPGEGVDPKRNTMLNPELRANARNESHACLGSLPFFVAALVFRSLVPLAMAFILIAMDLVILAADIDSGWPKVGAFVLLSTASALNQGWSPPDLQALRRRRPQGS